MRLAPDTGDGAGIRAIGIVRAEPDGLRVDDARRRMRCGVQSHPSPCHPGLPSAMEQAGNEQRVGFHLSGDDVSIEKFITVASKLTALLRELETSVTDQHGLQWQIADLQIGSASLAMRPKLPGAASIGSADAVIDAVLEGLATIEDAPRRPPHFSDEALRSASSLATAARDDANALVVFGEARGAQRQVTASNQLVVHVKDLVGTASVAIGALEGRLEALTIHDTIAFSIYDAATGRQVVCKCDRDAFDLAKQHFGKRVSVSGELGYNAQGEATSIKVDMLRAMTEDLPQVKDIRGLFSEHKVDIESWSRLVRDD